MGTVPNKVTPDLTFNYYVNDGRPLLKADHPTGDGVWACEVMAGQDYAGTTLYIHEDEILNILRQVRDLDSFTKSNDEWFESLPEGTLIHYHDGHNKFVRCEVRHGHYPVWREREAFGKHLVPFALVGDWRANDLPRRKPNGDVSLPHHAELIINGKGFRPGPSNLVENPNFHDKTLHPEYLDPVSLDLPPMTEEEEKRANLHKMRDLILEELKLEPTEEGFQKVAAIIDTGLHIV